MTADPVTPAVTPGPPTTAVRHETLDVDGPLHLVDFGGDGTPVVLVHGLGSSHGIWLAAGPLLARHARVVAVDLPGFGYSPLGRRSAAVDAAAATLSRALDTIFGKPAIVIGNSMGGVVAMLAARDHPGSVAGLVLVNPGLRRPSGVHLDREVVRRFGRIVVPFLGELHLDRHWRSTGPEGVVRASIELACADPTRVPSPVVDAMVDVVGHVQRSPHARRAYLEATRSLVHLAGSGRAHRRLVGGIERPTLLIAGEADRLVPVAAARAVAGERPDWTFTVMRGVGHTPQLEAPEEMVDVIATWMAGIDDHGPT